MPHGLYPRSPACLFTQIRQNLGWSLLRPSRSYPVRGQNTYALHSRAWSASFCLIFGRSSRSDKKKNSILQWNKFFLTQNQKSAKACRKTGPGVWRECRFSFFGCNRKSVKNRQGALKVFSGLMLFAIVYFFIGAHESLRLVLVTFGSSHTAKPS